MPAEIATTSDTEVRVRRYLANTKMINILIENAVPLLYSAFNIAAVTAIVIINKRVFKTFSFHFPILLLLIHTCVTYIGVRSAACFGAFEIKQLQTRPLIILACSFIFYNALSLMNLNINTVGFYQISKILVTPTVMVLESVFFDKGSSSEMKQAVGVMLAGVTMATVSDVDVGFVGFIVGMLAVLGAAQSQILIGHTQKSLNASGNQVLVAYIPFLAPMLAIVATFDMQLPENSELGTAAYGTWYVNHGSTEAFITIGVSACLGLLVSLSTFLLIGATSALTYNIVGHTKTLMILVMGVIVFGDSVSSQKMMGIGLALCGVFWYSKIKMRKQSPTPELPTNSVPKN